MHDLAALREEIRLLERILELRAALDSGGPLKATPLPEAVQSVQGPGDPRPVAEEPRHDGPSVTVPMRQVQGPVGPNDDGIRMEPDLSGADEVIRFQLTKAFETQFPNATEGQRVAFQGGLSTRIHATKEQLSKMVMGAVDTARHNPEATTVKAQLRV